MTLLTALEKAKKQKIDAEFQKKNTIFFDNAKQFHVFYSKY